MATRTIAAGGGNWNATGTWVELAVPINGDAVVALPAGASGQLTVNVASACTSIDFTNYTNTLTMTNSLTVAGNVTLVAGMTITGTGSLAPAASGTWTSAGKLWTGGIAPTTGSATITFADDWTIVGSYSHIGTGSAQTYNGSTLNVR